MRHYSPQVLACTGRASEAVTVAASSPEEEGREEEKNEE